MRAKWPVWGQLSLVALLLALTAEVARTAPVPVDEDKALREKALKLNEITGEDPITGMVMTLLEEKDKTKKLLAVAFKMAKDHAKDKDPLFNINATWILARSAHLLKDIEISEYFYRQNAGLALKLRSIKKFASAHEGLISLLFANKRYADVEKLCKEVLELPGGNGDRSLERFKLNALESLVRALARQGKTDQALRLVDNLLKNDPDDLLLHQLKGSVLRDGGKYEEAAKVYEDLIDRIKKAKGLKDDVKERFTDLIRYTLSGVYIDLKNVNKAAEHLKVLLAQDEKNPTYNNDLGYIWADHGMNLEEAEKMIRRAIEEERKIRKKAGATGDDDKDNPAYLDSLGWVLYKRKKYKEALPPLEEAIKHPDGQHLEIYDHLADVHIALKQIDKAIEVWKKGLACPPLSKRDAQRKVEVEKKMKQYEKKEKKE